MKLVVLGSNSFSGAHFVDFCLRQGSKVWGLSRSPEPHPVFLPYKQNRELKNFEFHQLDLNRDHAKIMTLIHDLKPDHVVNFAAQSMVAESWQHPEHWFQTNCVAQVRLHDGLRKCTFLKSYVHISTPEVYGSCSGNVTEEQIFNPSTPYAVSRAAADMSLKTFHRQYSFPVVFTRAANVFGPGQQLYRIIPRTMLFARLGKKLQLHGGGHSVRSFIDIEDVSDGTFKVMERGGFGKAYHLSTTVQISVRELVSKICDLMSVRFDDLVEVVDDRPGKDAAYLLDTSRIRRELKWSDRLSLDAGLKRTLEWMDQNLESLKSQPQNYQHRE